LRFQLCAGEKREKKESLPVTRRKKLRLVTGKLNSIQEKCFLYNRENHPDVQKNILREEKKEKRPSKLAVD